MEGFYCGITGLISCDSTGLFSSSESSYWNKAENDKFFPGKIVLVYSFSGKFLTASSAKFFSIKETSGFLLYYYSLLTDDGINWIVGVTVWTDC